MEQFTQACVPGRWAVDLVPALQYLPEWFPGTGWKQIAKSWNKSMTDLINIPFEYAANNSEYKPAFVIKALDQRDDERDSLFQDDIDFIKQAAASLYTGGM